MANLTRREAQTLALICLGFDSADAARELVALRRDIQATERREARAA